MSNFSLSFSCNLILSLALFPSRPPWSLCAECHAQAESTKSNWKCGQAVPLEHCHINNRGMGKTRWANKMEKMRFHFPSLENRDYLRKVAHVVKTISVDKLLLLFPVTFGFTVSPWQLETWSTEALVRGHQQIWSDVHATYPCKIL